MASEAQHVAATTLDRVRLERDRHVAFAFAAADLLIETAADGQVLAASGAAQTVLGLSIQALADRRLGDLATPRDQKLLRRLLRQVQELGRIDPLAVDLSRADGGLARCLLGACRLPDREDRVFVSVALLPCRLTPQPRDSDTGLLTAEALRDLAQRAAGDSIGGGARELQLLRLDGLSGAVRQLPADRADTLMQEIGAALRAASLGGDAAGRLAEDTFGLLPRPGHTDREDASLVRELCSVMRDAGLPDGQVGPHLARIDLTAGGLSPAEAGRVLSYAVQRLVSAAQDGFNLDALQDGLPAALQTTVGQVTALRQVVDQHRFTLAFQPVVALSGRAVHHYEVLSRFPGRPNTGEVIGFMEQLGLVAELDLAVARQALAALEQHPGLRLAVNLSGRSVQNEAFRTALAGLLTPAQVDRTRLLFELTESAALDQLEQPAAFLGWLRQLGHRLCLDDFGAGAAAYRYLRRFDVDFVKIDGPFLQAAAGNQRDRALIRSVCGLCQEIGSQVIGEMIETEAMAAMAATLGIGFGQGWLFGKPLPALPRPVAASRRRGSSETWQ